MFSRYHKNNQSISVTESSKNTESPIQSEQLEDRAYTESFDDVIATCSHTYLTPRERYEFNKNNKPSLTRKVYEDSSKSFRNNTESFSLLITYYRNPSVEVRNQLVLLHAGLVRSIAHRISRQCAEPYEPYQDLEKIGYLGLIRGIEQFNPLQKVAFSSFAISYIRGEILRFLRDKSNVLRIPRRWQELKKESEKVRQQLTVKLGRKVRDEEIAAVLNVSVDEWREIQASEHNSQEFSLDANVEQTMDSNPETLDNSMPSD